jgi:hypothetical protein
MLKAFQPITHPEPIERDNTVNATVHVQGKPVRLCFAVEFFEIRPRLQFHFLMFGSQCYLGCDLLVLPKISRVSRSGPAVVVKHAALWQFDQVKGQRGLIGFCLCRERSPVNYSRSNAGQSL